MRSLIGFLAWFVLLICLPLTVKAADTYQQITTLSSATALTIPDSDFQPFSGVVIHAEGGNIRWRNDGTNPTTTVGNLIYNTGFMVIGERLSDVKILEVTGSTKANIYYFRNPFPMNVSAPQGNPSALVTLDDAYENDSSVTVDESDVIWNLSSTQDFHIQDAGMAVFTVTDGGNTQIPVDEKLLEFGATQDFSIQYDGNDAVFTFPDSARNANLVVDAALSGDTNGGDLRLLNSTGSHPGIVLQRGTAGDAYTDWHVEAQAGNLYIEFRDGDPGTWEAHTSLLYTGEFGIGTVSPDTTLEVAGTLQVGDGDTDTDYTSISAVGNVTFTGAAGFYPHILSQDGEPAAGAGATQIDAGELMVWIDTNDSDKVYLVYNNGGTVVIELLE